MSSWTRCSMLTPRFHLNLKHIPESFFLSLKRSFWFYLVFIWDLRHRDFCRHPNKINGIRFVALQESLSRNNILNTRVDPFCEKTSLATICGCTSAGETFRWNELRHFTTDTCNLCSEWEIWPVVPYVQYIYSIYTVYLHYCMCACENIWERCHETFWLTGEWWRMKTDASGRQLTIIFIIW